VTAPGGRGRWERVLAARRRARTALGRDPTGSDLYAAPNTRKTPLQSPRRVRITPGPSVLVLTLPEAVLA
jgi:hypothetical protein